MNNRIRRTIVVALAIFMAIVPLSGAASAVTGGTINVYFHVIRRGSTTAEAPVTLTLSLSTEDVERIGGEPLAFTLNGNLQIAQVSGANGTGKTMSAVLLGNTLEAGVYSWTAVTLWPDGRTTTSPTSMLTVR